MQQIKVTKNNLDQIVSICKDLYPDYKCLSPNNDDTIKIRRHTPTSLAGLFTYFQNKASNIHWLEFLLFNTAERLSILLYNSIDFTEELQARILASFNATSNDTPDILDVISALNVTIKNHIEKKSNLVYYYEAYTQKSKLEYLLSNLKDKKAILVLDARRLKYRTVSYLQAKRLVIVCVSIILVSTLVNFYAARKIHSLEDKAASTYTLKAE